MADCNKAVVSRDSTPALFVRVGQEMQERENDVRLLQTGRKINPYRGKQKVEILWNFCLILI